MPGRIEGYEPVLAGVALLPLWRTVLRDRLERGQDEKSDRDAEAGNTEREPETDRAA